MRLDNRLLLGGTAVLGLLAWGGLGYLVYSMPPTLVYRLVFLALLLLATSASGVPVALLLNRRFADLGRERAQARALRQGLWAGAFVVLCTWLRMERSLTWAAALVFLGVFALLELLCAARD
jgi:Na+/proline symporter